MPRTVAVPSADGASVYFEAGASQAILFSPGLRQHPVMHDRGEGEAWADTRCGQPVFVRDSAELVGTVVLLRTDQALAFARPCRRCWP